MPRPVPPNERAKRVSSRFDIPIALAALAVIPALLMQESGAGQPFETIGLVLDCASWSVFAAELVVMLIAVDDRKLWLKQHPLDLFVVVFTPPILPPGLQAIRALRLVRLLRLFGVMRLSPKVFTLAGLQAAAVLALITMIGSGTVFAAAEGTSTWNGIWWSFTTMTLIGSDVHPGTVGGRLMAASLVIVGIGFVALLTGAVARKFLAPDVQEVEQELDELEAVDEDLLSDIKAVSNQLDRLERRIQEQIRQRPRPFA